MKQAGRIKLYQGFSKEIFSNFLLLFWKLLADLFFRLRGSLLLNTLDKMAIGNNNRKNIILNRMFDIIKLRNIASFIHKESIILLRYVEKIPVKPIAKAKKTIQSLLVIKYNIINATDMVNTVFVGSDFCFIMIIY